VTNSPGYLDGVSTSIVHIAVFLECFSPFSSFFPHRGFSQCRLNGLNRDQPTGGLLG